MIKDTPLPRRACRSSTSGTRCSLRTASRGGPLGRGPYPSQPRRLSHSRPDHAPFAGATGQAVVTTPRLRSGGDVFTHSARQPVDRSVPRGGPADSSRGAPRRSGRTTPPGHRGFVGRTLKSRVVMDLLRTAAPMRPSTTPMPPSTVSAGRSDRQSARAMRQSRCARRSRASAVTRRTVAPRVQHERAARFPGVRRVREVFDEKERRMFYESLSISGRSRSCAWMNTNVTKI